MQSGPATPVIKDVVLVGAGHAHVGVLRRFGMRPKPGVRLTLITRQVDTPYSGMLPGQIAGLYGFDETHIDTGPLCRFAGARLYKDEAIGLDLESRHVLCRDRPPVAFDLLSLDIGSTPNTRQVRGAAEHAVPVKPIDGFLDRFEAMRARVLASAGQSPDRRHRRRRGRRRAPVVAGASLAAGPRRGGARPEALTFHLITRSREVLPTFPKRMRDRFAAILTARGIDGEDGRARGPGCRGCARARGRDCPAAGRDPLDDAGDAGPLAATRPGSRSTASGFIRVGATLESVSHPGVFAAGDVAAVGGHRLPKSGVYAVRQGPVLADNIRRALTGQALAPYKPQSDALYIVSTGERYAIGDPQRLRRRGRLGVAAQGLDRPPVHAPVQRAAGDGRCRASARDRRRGRRGLKEISAIAMRCGGCGAKVGATVLSRALGSIEPAARDDVVIGLDAPDDAAVVDTGGPKLTVQTVDYFRAIVDDPYLFGKIAAIHALGDVYAMGGEPQTALAIATVPYGLEAKVEADLTLMMARRQRGSARRRLRARRRPYERGRGAFARLLRHRPCRRATPPCARAGFSPAMR